ncbi:MAG: hypothetical protein COT74_02000 [Bdellovibrionales bacterium CG10_big_fil_rev_8_21_14_0_10_45_34]|nr:MAG: hypothetical protein COT74_02000 [Bdellovibrionales bacterium CG10_big_fil_rev_8_21_14_0_10_45_34]
MAKVKIKSLPKNPLAEVFGHKTADKSASARKHRSKELCPFNNIVPECTKDRKDSPLAVCSIYDKEDIVIVCPVRFREGWKISKDAAEFFYGTSKNCTALREVRLKEKNGKSAGNIDLVIAKHDSKGKVLDFGAVEVQSVYVSGNIRNPFEYYMEDPEKRSDMDWSKEKHYPSPDFLSSSRKRLAPQMIYKGQILRAWSKKLAVVVDRPFFNTLPIINQTSKEKADVCWLIYELIEHNGKYELTLSERVYTSWEDVFRSIANPDIGDISDFISVLEQKLSTIEQFNKSSKNINVYEWAEL